MKLPLNSTVYRILILILILNSVYAKGKGDKSATTIDISYIDETGGYLKDKAYNHIALYMRYFDCNIDRYRWNLSYGIGIEAMDYINEDSEHESLYKLGVVAGIDRPFYRRSIFHFTLNIGGGVYLNSRVWSDVIDYIREKELDVVKILPLLIFFNLKPEAGLKVYIGSFFVYSLAFIEWNNTWDVEAFTSGVRFGIGYLL